MSYPNETRLANLEALLGTDTAAQLAWLAGVTPGTAAASMALVLNSSGGISTITSATITTLTSTTVNATTVNASVAGATVAATGAVTGINVPVITQCTTELDKATNTTPSAIVGLSQTVAVGKYDFECDLYGTAGASGGWNVSMVLTTAVISAINTSGFAYVSGSAPTITNNTTTTSTTALLAATAAVTNGRITGTITFSTGGTFALYFCQNASNGTTCSIYVGSKMTLTRTA